MTIVVLIVLKEVGTTEKKPFVDYSKIAYLSEFVLSQRLCNILNVEEAAVSHSDKDLLLNAFGKSELRKSYLSKIGMALEKKGFIGMEVSEDKQSVNWFIKPENIPAQFFDENIFKVEIQNFQKLLKYYKLVRTVQLSTIISKFFTKFGVMKWQV